MTHITVDDTQAEIIISANEGIEIRDRNGKHLGFVVHERGPANGAASQSPTGLGSRIADRFRGEGLDQDIDELRGYPLTPPNLEQ